jgi:hypothetical protein
VNHYYLVSKNFCFFRLSKKISFFTSEYNHFSLNQDIGNFSHKVTGPQRKKLSFHDEANAKIGESQFGNTDEMPRSSRTMTLLVVRQ